jgi:tetratricopeptide (TPR) repeat protein
VIFALALGVRLIHMWQIRSAPFFSLLLGDSRGYDEWARRLAAGDWIGHDVFYQAPLYPYLLGLIYAVAGRHLVLVRIVQAVLGSASCVFLALAARRIFSDRVGIAAGAMLALYAPAIFFDGLIQKSTLDVFLICVALWILAKNAEDLRSLLALGITMGLLALTRENAMVLIAVVAVWALVVHRARAAAVFVMGVAIVLVPVAARNAYVGGGFYVTTSQAGPNFYIGNNAHADGTYQSLRFGRGAPEYERQDATELAELELGRTLTPAEVSAYWTDRALADITAAPGRWARLLIRKFALLWNAAEAVDTESQESHAEYSLPLRVLGSVGHFGVLVPLAVFGMLIAWRDPSKRSTLRLLFALLAAYAASVIAFYVFARYRYPLVPLLMIFAAAGIVAIPDAIRSRSMPRSAWAVVLVAAFVNWPLLSKDLMRAVTETNTGAALQAERRFGDAEAHYRKAIALRPDYAPAYSNLGTALRAEGRRSDAVDAYDRAIALQPDFADAHYNLANALVDDAKPDLAVQHFQLALRSIPGSAEVHNNLGIALAARGARDEAIGEFRAAIAADPSAPKAHRNLGDLLASTGRTDEALAEFGRAAKLAPDDAATHYDYGSLLLEAGQLDEAVKEFRAALAIAPDSVETHNNLGIALGSQGKLDEAIEQFRAALAIRPNFAETKRNLEMAQRQRAAK